jgi:hypothetical protein
MRKDVMCVTGAFARADVYLCRNFGRRRLKRSMRDWEVGGGLGASVAKRRVCGWWRSWDGRWAARKRVLRSILVTDVSSSFYLLTLQA